MRSRKILYLPRQLELGELATGDQSARQLDFYSDSLELSSFPVLVIPCLEVQSNSTCDK
jgi:hypothetical protein